MTAQRYRRAADAAWVDVADGGDTAPVVWVALVPHGAPLMLAGSAWLVWTALTEAGTAGDTAHGLAARAARLLGGPVAVDDVRLFLRQLAGVGLIERVRGQTAAMA